MAKILVVDDDIDVVEATTIILNKAGYETVTASDGDECLTKARKEQPDLILLDVIMPVKNGFTAAEQLKKDPGLHNIPVLMLTAFSSKGAGSSIPRNSGFFLEAEDYLEKPIEPAVLLANIQHYLSQCTM